MSHPYRSNSSRHSNQKSSEFDVRQHFDAEILRFQKMLEEKETMLQTAADIGSQLLRQNEELQQRLRELEESKRRNIYENKQLQRQNEILRVAHEDAQAEIRQLREEILEKQEEIDQLEQAEHLRQTLSPSPSRQKSTSIFRESTAFSSQEMIDAMDQMANERDALASVVQDERQRSNDLTRKAEELQYVLTKTEKTNATLEEELRAMNSEFRELQREYEQEISRLSEENRNLQQENQLLSAEVEEQRQLFSRNDDFDGPRVTPRMTMEYDFNLDDELVPHTDTLDVDLNEARDQQSELELAVSDKLDTTAASSSIPQLYRSISDETHSPRVRASPRRKTSGKKIPSVDALEEFIHLTVTAAKINYADVPVSSSHLLQRIKDEKLPFHQVSGWLEQYLTAKRNGNPVSKTPSLDVSPYSKRTEKTSGPSSQYNFFKMLFGRTKASEERRHEMENRQVKLQVRYQKRMFEVRMRRKDTLHTLALTIPRFLDHKPEDIVFFHRDRELDIDDTLDENRLMSTDAIRMLERKDVATYLKKHKKKMQRSAKTQSNQYVPARMTSSARLSDQIPEPPPPRRKQSDSRYSKLFLESVSEAICFGDENDTSSDLWAYQVVSIDLTSEFARIPEKANHERSKKNLNVGFKSEDQPVESFLNQKRLGLVALGVSVIVWNLWARRRGVAH